MTNSYTAIYSRTSSGHMGQLVEWPEVVTEGKTIEDCREMLLDALEEMIRVSATGQGHTCRPHAFRTNPR